VWLYKNVLSWRVEAATEWTQRSGGGSLFHARGPATANAVIITGALGIVWFIFWWLLSAERPAKHATIIQDERIYIENAICETNKGVSNKVQTTYNFFKTTCCASISILETVFYAGLYTGWYLTGGTGDVSWSLDFRIPLTWIRLTIPGWDGYDPPHWNEVCFTVPALINHQRQRTVPNI